MVDSKINIAFIEYSHIFSGAETSLHSLIKNLNPLEFNSTIIFIYPQPHHSRYADLDCKKLYLQDKKKWWMGSDYWKNPIRGTDFLKRFILGYKLAIKAKRDRIDIIHVNLMRQDAFWWCWWPRIFGIKVVAHVRSDFWSWIPSACLQKQCNVIICVSDYVKQKVKAKYPDSPAFTVYDAVELGDSECCLSKNDALRNLGFMPGQTLLSSVGLLSAHKGHDVAIRVFSRLIAISDSYKDFVLLVAGGGGEDELLRLKRIAITLGIQDRVYFTENQIANIDTVYVGSSIVFSLTTRGEAFGRVPFEATFKGTPVLAPKKGAAMELISDGINGFLVDPLDENEVLERTNYILENYSESMKIVEYGKSYFKEKFFPKTLSGKVGEIYKSLV